MVRHTRMTNAGVPLTSHWMRLVRGESLAPLSGSTEVTTPRRPPRVHSDEGVTNVVDLSPDLVSWTSAVGRKYQTPTARTVLTVGDKQPGRKIEASGPGRRWVLVEAWAAFGFV
jgi:hypothetical protein